MLHARLIFALAYALFIATPSAADTQFNVTAISAQHGKSTIECWEVQTSFEISRDHATAGSNVAQLGDVSSMSLSYAFPGDEPEAHNAPANQWIVLLKGLAEIYLPHDESQNVFISGGEFGLLFAADTADVSCCGHGAKFLGSEEIVYLQIPTYEIPQHKRLHMGACKDAELTGWR